MADEELETEVLDLEDEVEGDEPEAETDEAENDNTDDDVLEIQFDDDEAAPASGDSSVIRQMRETIRRQADELATFRKTSAPAPIEVGPKPDLWDDCEGDQDKFEAALTEWNERKRKADDQQAESATVQEEAQRAWEADLQSFKEHEAKLNAPDMDFAKSVVTTALSDVQAATIIKAAKNPALAILALGKHPAKLQAISQIKDPIKLAAEIARMEGKITMAKRQSAPAPERVAEGSASVSVNRDKTLERLEAKAAKTGDRTELIRYRKGLTQKAA